MWGKKPPREKVLRFVQYFIIWKTGCQWICLNYWSKCDCDYGCDWDSVCVCVCVCVCVHEYLHVYVCEQVCLSCACVHVHTTVFLDVLTTFA